MIFAPTPYDGDPPYPPSEYEQQALDRIAYLWKRDDPDWVDQREQDWQFLLEECGYSEIPVYEMKLYEGYFKYGKMESHDRNTPTSNYIPGVTFFILTPYTSPEEAKLIFETEICKSNRADQILRSYIYIYAKKKQRQCHWFENHTRYFIEGVLGDGYRPVSINLSGREKNITPDPSYWCLEFSYAARNALQENRAYEVCYPCVNYFLSALPHCVDRSFREDIKLDKMMTLVNDCLNKQSLTGQALEFAQTLKQHEQEIWGKWAESGRKMLDAEK